MIKIREHISSIHSHFEPLLNHHTTQLVISGLQEIVALAASGVFLKLISDQVVKNQNVFTIRQIRYIIVAGPLLEEIVFRGVYQGLLEKAQEVNNNNEYRNLSATDLKAQRVFRVRAISFIFGAMHLANPHTSVINAIHQFAHTTCLGLAFGYFKEKYQTLSVPFLAHGLNNAFAIYIVTRLSHDSYTIVSRVYTIGLVVFYGSSYLIENHYHERAWEAIKVTVRNVFYRVQEWRHPQETNHVAQSA